MPTAILKHTETPISDKTSKSDSKKSNPRVNRALLGPTGPRTLRGKMKSRYNAMKYGIFANVVLRGKVLKESKADYLNLLQSFRENCQPVGGLEEFPVEKLAQIAWRQARLVKAEAAVVMEQTEFLRMRHQLSEEVKAGEGNLDMIRQTVGTLSLRKNRYLLEKSLEVLEMLRVLIAHRAFESETDEVLLKTVYGPFATTSDLFLKYTVCSKGTEKSSTENLGSSQSVEENKQEFLRALEEEIERLQQYGQKLAAQKNEELTLKEESLAVPATEELDKLLRYEARLDGSFDRTLTQLERLQRMRLGQPVAPPIRVDVSH